MCYSTKRKIADCVKELMYHKEIRKITIQDIMAATNMSRQSFYYHFKDIYDVLEWIAIHDFAEAVNCDENAGLEEWVLKLIQVIQRDKFFYDVRLNGLQYCTVCKNPSTGKSTKCIKIMTDLALRDMQKSGSFV